MRSVAILSALLLLAAGPVMAQGASVKGSETAPSNGVGTPNAATPTGQVSTATVAPSGTTTATPAPTK